MIAGGRLKLRAHDEEDLAVLSALLQDALIPAKEMTFLPRDKRFVLVANRFMWERLEGDPLAVPAPGERGGEEDGSSDVSFSEASRLPVFERVHSAVTFDRIEAVRVRGLDLKDRSGLYSLLSIKPEKGAVVLLFADDAAIRLECGRVRVHMEDIGEPWPTHNRPGHTLDERENAG